MSASSPPTPLPPNGRRARNSYLRGLAVGSIPLIIFWIFGGIAGYLQYFQQSPYNFPGATPFFAGLILGGIAFVALLISAIVCLAHEDMRPRGYGLLTMVFVSPVVAAGSCQIYVRILSAIPK